MIRMTFNTIITIKRNDILILFYLIILKWVAASNESYKFFWILKRTVCIIKFINRNIILFLFNIIAKFIFQDMIMMMMIAIILFLVINIILIIIIISVIKIILKINLPATGNIILWHNLLSILYFTWLLLYLLLFNSK